MKMVQERFENLLDEMGQTVAWYNALRCPCFDARSGEANMSCSNCSGKGITYAAPVSCNIAFSGMNIQKEWAGYGRFESGDIVITVGANSAAYAIGFNDKIVMTQSSIPFETTGSVGTALNLSHVISVDPAQCLISEQVVSRAVTWNNGLVWTNGAPTSGTPFTITGRKNPVYFAYTDFPRDRHHYHGIDYPRNIVLRVYDVAGR